MHCVFFTASYMLESAGHSHTALKVQHLNVATAAPLPRHCLVQGHLSSGQCIAQQRRLSGCGSGSYSGSLSKQQQSFSGNMLQVGWRG
jgi:hypothetical protein